MVTEALSLHGVNTYFGESHVLQNFSLSLHQASILALLGRNGVGKSTCIHSIIGFVRPRSGEIFVFGEPVTGLAPEKIAGKGVGLVPQGRRIFANLTVEENLSVAMHQSRSWNKGSSWSLQKVFDRFPRLRERRKNLAATLSGGEQQLLAISRALVGNPRVLLLDEPSEGLAPQIVTELQVVIRELKADGLSVLLVEQNAGMALALADDVMIMNTGGVSFSGTVDEIRLRPEFLAAELGVG